MIKVYIGFCVWSFLYLVFIFLSLSFFLYLVFYRYYVIFIIYIHWLHSLFTFIGYIHYLHSLFNMDTKTKKIGTREEVYNGIALRTAGGLQKNDIIEKKIGNRIIYISKKLSDKMKENVNILRTHNPNFLKKLNYNTKQ